MPTTATSASFVKIEEEMRQSYLDYAMSVIVGRALPDVRDGLKPAHRRVLYAMFREGLLSDRRYSKCAGVVGEVLKKFHPHGDAAVYDTLVRMAQEWNLRYPLVDGQGNFGSLDGDPPAAYRYTEARMSRVAEAMLADIDEATVDFVPNFDESSEEPVVLPSRVPNLLVNGSAGIAVGMATNIPPHNLGEVVQALVLVAENADSTLEEILGVLPGPDFPTAGIIHGRRGIRQAYETGKGILQVRGRVMVESAERGDRSRVVVTEIPYQVNKARLVEKIAELVREKRIEGVTDLRDESSREGIRIVLDLKRETIPGVIVNQLYKLTPLQTSFGVTLLAIVDGQPRTLGLREVLRQFLSFRKEVVTRRSVFELERAEARAHILEGIRIALDHIDEVISLIRASRDAAQAREALVSRLSLSVEQAQAILEMRLQRLTGLERDKVLEELKGVLMEIARLREILANERLVVSIVVEELKEVARQFGDERRTEILDETAEIGAEDLIAEEDMVVTISHRGYVKRNPLSLYRSQRRGGKGVSGMETKEEDFVQHLFVASTHSYLVFFTSQGRAFWIKVHEVPAAGRVARGRSLANLLLLDPEEKIRGFVTTAEFSEGRFAVQATRMGLVKKTELAAYANARGRGVIAQKIDEGDELIDVKLTDGAKEIFLTTREGMSIRFHEEEVRPTGRNTRGVRGIDLEGDDEVVAMDIIEPGATVLTITANGFGKRTAEEEYRVQGRGGKGIITIKTSERNGPVVGVQKVTDEDDIMIITDGGKVIRTPVADLRVISRNTQGVKLIDMEEGERVADLARLAEKENGNGREGPEPA